MVQGLGEMNRKWGSIPTKVRAAIREVLQAQAERIVAEMRAAAPKQTGALAASINWTWGAPPSGAMTIGTVQGDANSRLRITIYAGGSPKTKRQQRQASGTRKSDQGRTGTFATDNARFQEFGTSKMAANPFFFPVWRTRRQSVRSRITRTVNQAIRDAVE